MTGQAKIEHHRALAEIIKLGGILIGLGTLAIAAMKLTANNGAKFTYLNYDPELHWGWKNNEPGQCAEMSEDRCTIDFPTGSSAVFKIFDPLINFTHSLVGTAWRQSVKHPSPANSTVILQGRVNGRIVELANVTEENPEQKILNGCLTVTHMKE
ncbi:MAG: hypothetical protein US11_C0003G0064 [Candidatus Roizmanbacteria bacterium GW2011_GWA2_36_23]|uniref:Uncharacterized protein n=1 Tax=Candidatus Roizmanbacteria bacterium GW2011_GWA2_36_23 TaxID=1618480 RepID=A0A0G0HDA8_9BACT|nr:MAG: hypothetical protein US11_C0003G0064 [Candidatus Roizmanbacteria bacterium GW2011_GWA2_36_23]